MIQTAFGLPSEGKSFTHEQNMANAEIPDLTFLSKGQLRRMIETMCYEQAKFKNQRIKDQEKLLDNEKEIGRQRDVIIELYNKLLTKDPDNSLLKIAG
jgi:hypothetical protein